MHLYLRRWEFTPQQPLTRARQRSDAAIAAWLQRDYPKIARRARQERALIYWGDETGISNQDQIGRGYAPKGQTPVVHKTAKKLATSMISAVNNRGLMRFMCFAGALNAALFIVFLRRLIASGSGKLFLIVDNLRVHHAVKVRRWVEAHRGEIELLFLPPYVAVTMDSGPLVLTNFGPPPGVGQAVPPRLVSFQAARARMTASGSRAMTRKRVAAGPDGRRRPCSYCCTRSMPMPKARANFACDMPNRARIVFTSSGVGGG